MIIDTLEGKVEIHYDGQRVRFIADADIDADGGENIHGDKCWQPDTALHYAGKPLDALSVPFCVVPPLICAAVKPMVLGCQAALFNMANGLYTPAVVGDIGPTKKFGEISPAAASLLGVDPNSVSGGTDDFTICYVLFPGKPATVRGRTYQLQPWK